jgi:hypothetical protein
VVVVSVDSVLVSVLMAGVAAAVKVFVDSVLVSVLTAGVATAVKVFVFNFLSLSPVAALFFSGAGDEAGATTSVFCSHAPRSAAPARMQINFFIVWIGCPYWD